MGMRLSSTGKIFPSFRREEFASLSCPQQHVLRMKFISLIASIVSSIFFGTLAGRAGEKLTVTNVREVKGDADAKPLYFGNRAPLAPSGFMKLPIGSITPRGWLRQQLDLEKNGMTGRLKEISPWLRTETSAWANKNGVGERGWEELPYWLKGYGDLGYVLKDSAIIVEARKWIEAVLSSQREDGWFGPRDLLKGLNGKPDLWPHMVMLNILQSYYEFTSDPRVLQLMTRYFQWENQLPATAFGEGYWPKIRAGDNIESAYWLYNRMGGASLLELARKIHENMARWDQDVINWHNVNISQGFREPAVYYLQAKDEKFLRAAERNYEKVMDLFGQFPGGGFGGDENCRPGFTDPRQGFETCGIVEFMHSFEMLTKISGDPLWSDRCEEIAFNSFPASLTPDWKGLHYLTCANQVQLDHNNKAPAIENGGTMFSYSPFQVYRCCQHNVSHGWPYYSEELWLATADRGLCASLYAASEVTAKVGDGATVRIAEETDYPFNETVQFKISLEKPAQFPLYLRIPRWCQNPSAKINGKNVSLKAKPLTYLIINQIWKNGDTVTLQLPMRVSIRRWAKNQNAASVDYGPLTFSLKIGEKWVRYGGTDTWPENEVLPTTPWNYGLELNARKAEKSFTIVRKPGPLESNPFTPETAPVELKAKARRIPAWEMDRFGMVGKLQASPVKSEEPVETISLIPMGAARLRISSFPVIGLGKDAKQWTKPQTPAVTASHCFQNDSVEAMVDGIEPKSSNDSSIPRFTWWDHRGMSEWVEWGFPKARKVSAVDVYWFDDGPKGGCRVPQSWKLFYRVGENWKPVEGAVEFGTRINSYNHVTFNSVEANGLRIEAQLQPDYSGGILEWKAN